MLTFPPGDTPLKSGRPNGVPRVFCCSNLFGSCRAVIQLHPRADTFAPSRFDPVPGRNCWESATARLSKTVAVCAVALAGLAGLGEVATTPGHAAFIFGSSPGGAATNRFLSTDFPGLDGAIGPVKGWRGAALTTCAIYGVVSGPLDFGFVSSLPGTADNGSHPDNSASAVPHFFVLLTSRAGLGGLGNSGDFCIRA